MKFFKITAVVLVLSFIFISCGKKTVAVRKGPLPEKTVSGNVLNLYLDDTVDTLDQQIAVYATSFEVIGSLVEGLKKTNADGSISNALCESETVSSDGLIYTFKIRQDAYWSNGDPVTAHDFVYAWQRGVDPANESEYAFLFGEIAQIKNASAIMAGQMEPNQLGVRALDDYTLQVQLQVPVSFFDNLLNFCTFFPANQKFIESVGDQYGKSAETYLSNSAFILSDYKQDAKSFKLIKNTAYYNAANVKIAGLNYTIPGSVTEALRLYNSNKLDMMELDAENLPSYVNAPDFRLVDTGFMYFVSVNTRVPKLQNLNLRRALTLAFDRNEVTKAMADGSKPAWTAVPAGYAFDRNGVDFSKTGVEFKDVCDYNPSLAREYFEKAKKELGMSKITIEFVASENKGEVVGVTNIKNQIEKNLPGITINPRFVERKERRKVLSQGNYEIGMTNWGPDYTDPMTYLSMWMTGNDNNNGDYHNPNYDAILASCSDGDLCTKIDERWKALKQAEIMIMEDAVIWPVFSQCNADLIKSNVSGIEFHAVGTSKVYRSAQKR